MTTGLVRKTIDVVLGNPETVAHQIEVAFDADGIAAVGKVEGSIVKIDISLLEDVSEGTVDATIEQAVKDAAATIRWSDRTVAAAAKPEGRGALSDAKDKLQGIADTARDAIHDATAPDH